MRTILLFGGTSSERRVSVASAQNLVRHVDNCQLWFWDAHNSIHEVDTSALTAFERPFERDFPLNKPSTWPSLEHALDILSAQPAVLFLAVHGGDGENGELQKRCEQRGIAFTGSGSTASQNAFNKILAKDIVRNTGLRTAPAYVLENLSAEKLTQTLADLWQRHHHLVVKPVADGSSVGLCFIHDERTLRTTADTLLSKPGVAHLAEPFIEGRELTVGVIETHGHVKALPCSEVRIERGRSFDYDGKYLGKGSTEITPADVSKDIFDAAQQVALRAHQALGCRGYTRTDMIVSADGPVFLETNTLPGLTAASFIPQQLAAAGISMRDFVREQLALAKERQAATP